MKNPRKVLVIANNVRSVVSSAKKAGYSVYALDRFGDVDMRRCADKAFLIESSQEISAPVVQGSAGVTGCAPSPLRLINILRRLGGSEVAAPAPLTLFPAAVESLVWSAVQRIN